MRTGQLELAMAEERTLERDPEYAEAATEWIRGLRHGARFNAESMRRMLGDPPGHGDVLGTICRNARRSRLIAVVDTVPSKRPERHGARIIVWQRI